MNTLTDTAGGAPLLYLPLVISHLQEDAGNVEQLFTKLKRKEKVQMKFRILSTLMIVPLLLNQLSSCENMVLGFIVAHAVAVYSSALNTKANLPKIYMSVLELGTAEHANLKIKVKVPGPPIPKRLR